MSTGFRTSNEPRYIASRLMLLRASAGYRDSHWRSLRLSVLDQTVRTLEFFRGRSCRMLISSPFDLSSRTSDDIDGTSYNRQPGVFAPTKLVWNPQI